MTIELIGRAFPHHAHHSGYHRIAEYLSYPLRTYGLEGASFPEIAKPYLNQWYRVDEAFQEHAVVVNARRQKTDLIHYIYGDQHYRIAGILGAARTKWVATFHQPTKILENLGLDRTVINSLSAVIIVSELQREFFERFETSCIYTIPHGIDCQFFYPDEKEIENFRIVTVGHWLRDSDLYFRVVTRAYDLGLPLTFRLITRITLPESLIPRNCIIIKGLSDLELRVEYQKAACLFLPLWDSTANNTLLEALACGTPYVVSDVGGVREYVDESGGELISGRHENTWLESLMRRSQCGPDHAICAAAARSLALRKDWSVVATITRTAYNEITTQK